MNYIHRSYLSLILLIILPYFNAAFSPDTSDYDAYGVKIAMNDHFLVLAQNGNNPPSFFIQFAPYNQTQSASLSAPSMQCSIAYPSTDNFFVYTVAIGKQQNQSQIHFFFAGEQYSVDQSTPFIGMATFNRSGSCGTSFTYSVRYLTDYQHQEYYVIAAHPSGRYVYGFSNEFVFTFSTQNTSDLSIWFGNATWSDTTFIPHAVDLSDGFGVVAGFTRTVPSATVKYEYGPMIYLIGFSSSNSHQPIVVHDQNVPLPTANTWQALLTNADANYYSPKYDMSVSIEKNGKVLVGMQFINRGFLLSVNVSNPVSLTNISRFTNGRALGNGKSVAWFDNGIAAVLINVYTMTYEWTLSQVFIFDVNGTGYNSNTTALSVFPNSHQVLPTVFSSVFVNVISSSSSYALLDDQGRILIVTPTESGFYPMVKDTGEMPFLTTPDVCSPGTYKNLSGVHDCVLCPTGTKNPGSSSTSCISCASNSFCPLGSVADVPKSALTDVVQGFPYPLSPESTVFDEILLHNMFSIGKGGCVVKSPLFWALVIACACIVIGIMMEIWRHCIKHPKSERVRNKVIWGLTRADLINEGEYWFGGLASCSVIVLVCFSYAFGAAYLKQYPIETAEPSYLICDAKTRNAKFESHIQSSAIPPIHEEEKMFELLRDQKFILNVEFINTLIGCEVVSIEALFGLKWSVLRWLECDNTAAILKLSVELPYQQISVRFFLDDEKTIGALRIGFDGEEVEEKAYTLRKLHFYEAISKNGYLLSQTLPVAFSFTKIINQTHPMTGDESEFSGLYVPTFTVDENSLFVLNNQYVSSSLTMTTLTIVISETPYYVKNIQQPIARQSEIIFRNLLFTIVCLEIAALVFVIYGLAFKPLYKYLIKKCTKHTEEKTSMKNDRNGDLFYDITETNGDPVRTTL